MPKIFELYGFIAEDNGPEDEGLMAFVLDNKWMPMVAADMARVKDLLPIAEHISKTTKKPFRVLRFTYSAEVPKSEILS